MSRAAALAYHAVTDRWPHPLAIPPDRFRAQLRRLADRGLRGVTLSEAARGGAGTVAITFDDGFASVMTAAKPVLDELGWRASVFVVTDHVGSGEPMLWLGGSTPEYAEERLPLTWAEVGSLAAAGWEVGSHTKTHRPLSGLPDDELDDELRGSRRAVEEHVGSCSSISYPYGELDARVVEATRQAGYRAGSGLAGRFRFGDPLLIPRVAVGGRDDGLRFAVKTSRLFGVLRATPAWGWLDGARRRPRPLGA